jgi:hypothetical protein
MTINGSTSVQQKNLNVDPNYCGPLGVHQSMERNLNFGEDLNNITNKRALEILQSIKSDSNTRSFFKKPIIVLVIGLLAATATIFIVATIGRILFISGAVYGAFTNIALSVAMSSSFIIGTVSTTKYVMQAMGDITSGRLSRSSEEWKYQALQADHYIRLIQQKNLSEVFDINTLA